MGAENFADPVANTFLQGLAEVLEEQDINLLIIPSRYELAYLSGVETFVEGFIVYGPPSNDRLDELLHYKKEIVAIDFQIDGFPSVTLIILVHREKSHLMRLICA